MVPMLLVWSVVVVPLSLPAVADCGVVYVYSVLGLWSPGLESVPEAPREARVVWSDKPRFKKMKITHRDPLRFPQK